jgi:hypothetical protein
MEKEGDPASPRGVSPAYEESRRWRHPSAQPGDPGFDKSAKIARACGMERTGGDPMFA